MRPTTGRVAEANAATALGSSSGHSATGCSEAACTAVHDEKMKTSTSHRPRRRDRLPRAPHATTHTPRPHAQRRQLSLSLSLSLSPSLSLPPSLYLCISPPIFLLRAQQLGLKSFCRLRPPRHALDRPRTGLRALREHAPAEIGARPRQEPQPGRGSGMSPRLALPWWAQEDAFHIQQPCVRRPKEVEVIYRCVAAPEQQGQSYRFAKYYFSNDQQIQWLHVRTSPDLFFIWSPSPTEFDVWPS